MPELINANPTVLAASAIPSRHANSSPDPFQDLLTSHTAPEDDDFSLDDTDPERFDAQEIYGPFLPLCLPSRTDKQTS
jgi:hypothetical protein